jgi:predicted ATP-binding protein involved in virulence
VLKRLIVQGLRGYAGNELTIGFNPDINLVTGRNGSGKTTLLKLAWYLISGNIQTAAEETPFQYAFLETSDYSLTVDLTDPDDHRVIFEKDGVETVFRNRTIQERDESDELDFDEDVLEDASRHVEDFGRSIYFPTFRRVEGGYTIPRESRPHLRTISRRRPRSSLEEGLDEISTRLSNMGHTFICSVSTNDVVDLVWNKYNSVTERYSKEQQEISNKIIAEIRHYEQKDSNLPLNSADEVITRIKSAIEAMDSTRVELMKSLVAVEETVVQLFTHRGISFGDRYSFGEKPDAIMSEYLSAGEKQMLSFICYNAFFDNSVIFIDEPELSLHVDWQRQLFPILERQDTTNQFIVATHSPFIYSKYPEKELLLGSDRGD